MMVLKRKKEDMMMYHCSNKAMRVAKKVSSTTAGCFFLFIMLVLFGSAHMLYSQTAIDLSGKVTTKQGAVAYDVTLTLLSAKISVTADTAGSYHFLRQGTGAFRRGQQISQPLMSDGAMRKEVCFGGSRLTDRWRNSDASVIDLHGRAVGSAHEFFGQNKKGSPEGVYFLYRGALNQKLTGETRQVAAIASTDTLSLSYQGTLLKKVPVSVLTGNLNISLDADLPVRKHSVLVASYSNNSAYILSADNRVEWEYKMPGAVQDAWMLQNGNILLSGGSDIREVTRSKEVVWKYTASSGEMHNCYPLPGNVVLFGENSSGKLFEINRATNTILRTIQTSVTIDNHSTFRMVRKTYDSTYLVVAEGEGNVYELSKTGAVVRKINVATLKNSNGVTFGAVHSALKLVSGNILIGGGYNSPFIEVDKKDSVVWKLTAADIPEIGFNYAAAGQILPGGTFVFSAYTSTYKIVEVSRAKKVLWKLQNNAIGNPTHVCVTDCWDTKCDTPAPETLVR